MTSISGLTLESERLGFGFGDKNRKELEEKISMKRWQVRKWQEVRKWKIPYVDSDVPFHYGIEWDPLFIADPTVRYTQ